MNYVATLVKGQTYTVSSRNFEKDKPLVVDEKLAKYLERVPSFQVKVIDSSVAIKPEELLLEIPIEHSGGAIEVADLGTAVIKSKGKTKKT